MNKRMDRKRRNRFRYQGFGFPVILVDVPMVRVRGAWTPDVNYNRLSSRLLEVLARKPARLTGNEIRFIRHSLEMTLAQFATRFGITHPAVIKWEKTGNRPTMMTWALEKDIRLEILRSGSVVNPAGFLAAYGALKEELAATSESVRLPIGRSA